MGIALDVILIAIVIINIVFSYKKGFVRTIVRVVGMVFVFVISVSVSTPLSDFTYDRVVQPAVVKNIENSLSDNPNSLEKVYEVLPEYVKNNFDVFELGSLSSSTASEICETAVKPFAVSFLRTVYISVIFIVLSIAVAFLSVFLNSLFSFSIIGKVNRALGGCLGAIEGVIFSMIFVIVLRFVVSLTGGFLIFTENAFVNSKIFGIMTLVLPQSFLI